MPEENRGLGQPRGATAALAVDDLAFGVANAASPDLQARATVIFALAQREARRAIDALVARDPRLQAALAAAPLDVPEVVAPVRLVIDGRPDGVLARELGDAVAWQVVEQARRLADAAAPSGLGAQALAAPATPATAVPGPPPRPTISPETEALMRADVERVVVFLKAQWMSAADEREVLSVLEKWASADDQYRSSFGYRGSDYLDRFLFFLKMRTFPRRTARTAWIEQWTNAYDALWYEMEDDRLAAFKALVARSQRQATTGPETERLESVWSYVGKREAMGVWGVLKGMGLTLAGVVDSVIWLEWKTRGVPLRRALEAAGVKVEDQPPSLARYLDKSYDEVARELAGAMASTSKEQEQLLNEKLLGDTGPSAYEFGTFGGKVVGALTTAGAMAEMGAAGQAIGAVQTAQAAEGLYDTVKKLRQGPPPLSWSDIARRPDVWAQVVGVVGGAIGAGGSFAKAGSAAAKTLGDLGVLANTTQIALLVAAYQAVDEDSTLGTPEEKRKAKEEFLLQIVTTGLLTVDQRYGPRFQETWARKFRQGTGQPAPGAPPPAAPPSATGQAEPTRATATSEAIAPPATTPEPSAPAGRPGAPLTFEQGMALGAAIVQGSAQPGARPAGAPEAATAGPRSGPTESVPAVEKAAAPAGEGTGQPARATVEQLRPALEAGGDAAAAAARALITQVKDWKGEIRRLAGPRGELGPAAATAIEQARAALIEQALSQVRQKYPDVQPTNVGSPGLGSDVDISFNPRTTPRPDDSAAMAAAIRRSGEAAREFLAALRRAAGGEPDVVLDTNAYTYTGIEHALPGGEAAARQMDVASLAEIHRAIQRAHGPNAPAEWARFRREALRQLARGAGDVGPDQARVEKALADDLTRQFREAEELSRRVSEAESSLQSLLARRARQAGEAAPDQAALLAQARERAAATRRAELVDALQREPVDVGKVRRLQAEIKLLEPGAYASGAAIADVVQYQQALKGSPTHAAPGQEVVDVRTGEAVTIGRQVIDPRELAQSAASNLALLAEHMHGRTGDPTALHDQLKAIAKYCSRIDHARQTVGLKEGVPEIASRYRTADTDEAARVAMVDNWSRRVGASGSFAERANAFISAHYAWAQEQTVGLRLIAMTRPALTPGTREVAGGPAPVSGGGTPTGATSASSPSGGGGAGAPPTGQGIAEARAVERGRAILEAFEEAQGSATSGALQADVLAQPGVQATARPGGKPQPRAFDVGNFSHEYAEDLIPASRLPRGLRREFTITLPGQGEVRLDRVDFANGMIYEIKPDSPSQVSKGNDQVRLYVEYMNREHPLSGGRRWRGQVVTYDREAALRVARAIGWIEREPEGQ